MPEEPCHHLSAEKPTIKILLYTDASHRFRLEPDDFYSLDPMIQHLMGHAPTFAHICPKLVGRYSDDNPPKVKKINVALEEELCKTKKPFDQIWFFGLAHGNKAKFSRGLISGGPDSELDGGEVTALTSWMSVKGGPGGGVLMMGDHSNEVAPMSGTFLGLGRALGRCVPRAGRLRIWEGGPTTSDQNSHNTVGAVGSQDDLSPQELMLRRFNEKGEPSSSGQPHPIFFYRQGSLIESFPDHFHEGAVVLPKIAPEDQEWPKGKCVRPVPRKVACGVNKRNFEIITLVAAYDGDAASVGRIVADSTWHHYISMNLTNFHHPAPVGSSADQIGQYYGNLSIWLSPRATRQEMAKAMFWWLADHPRMIEEVGGEQLAVGRAAYALLSSAAQPCEIHELLLASVPDSIRKRYEMLYFHEGGDVLSEFPSKELILGCVIDAYHKEMIKVENSVAPQDLLTAEQVIDAGFKAAFKEHWKLLAQVESAARILANL